MRMSRLYLRYLEWDATNCSAWCKFAELERSLGEVDRVRGIFELAIQQSVLDMPEILWKVSVLSAAAWTDPLMAGASFWFTVAARMQIAFPPVDESNRGCV